jgi:hypothetical protein
MPIDVVSGSKFPSDMQAVSDRADALFQTQWKHNMPAEKRAGADMFDKCNKDKDLI